MALTRGCAVCGQRDTHPRHVVGILNRPGVGPPTPKHLDCCAAAGCALCQQTMREAGGRTGQDLIDHLAAQRAARAQEETHG